jgi:hypothetical protein
MKKNFVDSIEDEANKNENTPSPADYEKDKSFGKTGFKYSFP